MCGYFCIGFIYFMLAGKTLTAFTNLFLPNNFKKNDDIILNYFMTMFYLCLKMAQCNSHNIYPNQGANPSNEQKFWLNKLNEIKDYFIAEIKERKLMSHRL